MVFNKSSFQRKVYSNEILPQERRKISNKKPKLTSKESRKNKFLKKAQSYKEGDNKCQRRYK